MRLFILVAFLLGTPAFAACVPPDETSPVVMDGIDPGLVDDRHRAEVIQAAIDGRQEAAACLADFYLYGPGDNQDEAIKWLRRHAEIVGKPSVMLGELLTESDDSNAIREGRAILETLALAGDSVAARKLGDSYLSAGEAVLARAWYQHAAIHGDSSSAIKLADSFAGDVDITAKRLEVFWLDRALERTPPGSFLHGKLSSRRAEAGRSIEEAMD